MKNYYFKVLNNKNRIKQFGGHNFKNYGGTGESNLINQPRICCVKTSTKVKVEDLEKIWSYRKIREKKINLANVDISAL